MEKSTPAYQTIDEYIRLYPQEIQDLMETLRQVIKEEAPLTIERIAYGMPTFWQEGNVCHFAAFKNHIGFFPGANGVAAFISELGAYKTSKGTIQFPYGQAMPLELVRRIVRFRVAENIAWAEENKKAKRPLKKKEEGF
ncbi:MAG: DUF1801 domain-containing protein [Erysipelotrichaceae bacterium]